MQKDNLESEVTTDVVLIKKTLQEDNIVKVAEIAKVSVELVKVIIENKPIRFAYNNDYDKKKAIATFVNDYTEMQGIKIDTISENVHLEVRRFILENYQMLSMQELYVAYRLCAAQKLVLNNQVLDITFYNGLFDINKLGRVLDAYIFYKKNIQKSIQDMYSKIEVEEFENHKKTFEFRQRTDITTLKLCRKLVEKDSAEEMPYYLYDYLLSRSTHEESYFLETVPEFNPTKEEKKEAWNIALKKLTKQKMEDKDIHAKKKFLELPIEDREEFLKPERETLAKKILVFKFFKSLKW